jgi:hypothetical protein
VSLLDDDFDFGGTSAAHLQQQQRTAAGAAKQPQH